MFRKQNYDMPINAINILDSIFGVKRTKKDSVFSINCFELSINLIDF